MMKKIMISFLVSLALATAGFSATCPQETLDQHWNDVLSQKRIQGPSQSVDVRRSRFEDKVFGSDYRFKGPTKKTGDAREHIYHGEYLHDSKKGVVLSGGMHTEEAVNTFAARLMSQKGPKNGTRLVSKSVASTDVSTHLSRAPVKNGKDVEMLVEKVPNGNGATRVYVPRELVRGKAVKQMEAQGLCNKYWCEKTLFPKSWKPDDIELGIGKVLKKSGVKPNKDGVIQLANPPPGCKTGFCRFTQEVEVDGKKLKMTVSIAGGKINSAYPAYPKSLPVVSLLDGIIKRFEMIASILEINRFSPALNPIG